MTDARTPRLFGTPKAQRTTMTPATGPRVKLHEIIPAIGMGVKTSAPVDVIPLGREQTDEG